MTQTHNAVIDKIKKILSLAESANENEAALASERAHELLERYNLSLAEVESQGLKDADSVKEESFTNVGSAAQVSFFSSLAHIFDCYPYIHTKSRQSKNGNWYRTRTTCVIGHRQDIEVLSYTHEYLKKTVKKLYAEERDQWLQQFNGRRPSKKYLNMHKQSYLRGFGDRVALRLIQARDERLSRNTEEARTTQALVHQRKDKVHQWIRKNMEDMQPGRPRRATVLYDGYEKGLEAGDSVHLQEGLDGEKSKKLLT